MKINLPLDEIETGVDYLRVTLNEKVTSLPRPLVVRLFYIH